MFKHIPYKSADSIFREWDALAPIRLKQILSGRDITYNKILAPLFFDLISKEKMGSMLDLGCGVGVMTDQLAQFSSDVTGVDPSIKSIKLAKITFGQSANFINASAEDFSQLTKKRFSVIVSNMVLMDTLDLREFLLSTALLMKRGGAFIFSITHPCFWPEYYGYSKKSWFDYKKELIIESPFKISSQPDCRLHSTHIHRPLEAYISAILEAGFNIEQLYEPMPSEEVAQLYPKPWRNPRYLVGVCRLPKRI